MDNHSLLLNSKWKNYFNWTVIYPLIFFFLFITIVFLVALIGFSSVLAKDSFEVFTAPLMVIAVAMAGTMTLGYFALTIGMIVYWIWFIIASDNLFKMLSINRLAGNILNLLGLFILPGLSFLILPIFFWIKMRDYWDTKAINANWRAVV